jgi:hypothetical protein
VSLGPLEPQRFAQALAARVEQHHDPMRSLCLACTDVLDVTGAGLMLMSANRSFGTVGVSDPVAEAVEEVEYTLGEGPCVTAYRTQTPVFDDDLAAHAGARWPEFRRAALAQGVQAAFGFPLVVGWICIGAMNLYRDTPGPLTAGQIDDATVVAGIASHTLMGWQSEAPPGTVAWQLDNVSNHRMEVHQAAGRISVQADITVADALVLLRAFSFSQDRPIADVAKGVATGVIRFD